jgi:uncharacterized protein YciI
MSSEYLYRLVPTRAAMLTDGPTPEEDAAVEAHYARLQRLVAEGVVLLAGRTTQEDAATFGIVIFRAQSDVAARDMMLADPSVAAGEMRAELFPFRVSLLAERWLEA